MCLVEFYKLKQLFKITQNNNKCKRRSKLFFSRSQTLKKQSDPVDELSLLFPFRRIISVFSNSQLLSLTHNRLFVSTGSNLRVGRGAKVLGAWLEIALRDNEYIREGTTRHFRSCSTLDYFPLTAFVFLFLTSSSEDSED